MKEQESLEYLWKDIDRDTEDEIIGKVYPRTILYLRWGSRTFHVIENENGEYYFGYSKPHFISGPIYVCTESFIEKLIECVYKAEIPEEIHKYYSDEEYLAGPKPPLVFWAIECRWKECRLRFIDNSNQLTRRFEPKAQELIKTIESEIDQQKHICPYIPQKKGFLSFLRKRRKNK